MQLQYVKEGSEIEKKVAEAIRKGNMIEGIKIYRDYSGVDLATATGSRRNYEKIRIDKKNKFIVQPKPTGSYRDGCAAERQLVTLDSQVVL